eukprot:UC4_evm10s1434
MDQNEDPPLSSENTTTTPGCIVFANDFDAGSSSASCEGGYKLMELPKDVMDALSSTTSHQSYGTVVFKGGPNDDAVLCTEEKTYGVKSADTTNSLLLLESTNGGNPMDFSLSEPKCLVGKTDFYLELTEIPPRLEKLKAMLSKNFYSGPFQEKSSGDGGTTYGWDDLVAELQASDQEIRSCLENLNAVSVDNKFRLLKPHYKYHIMDKALTELIVQRTPLSSVSARDLYNQIEWDDQGNAEVADESLDKIPESKRRRLNGENSVPYFAFVACLKELGAEVKRSDSTSEGDVMIELLPIKIVQFRAIELLSIGNRWAFDDFLESWVESLNGHEFEPNVDQLRGIALTNASEGKAKQIWLYDHRELPLFAKDRFSSLFNERDEWLLDDITPYLEGIADSKMTVEKLLFKYTREMNPEKIPHALATKSPHCMIGIATGKPSFPRAIREHRLPKFHNMPDAIPAITATHDDSDFFGFSKKRA